MNTLNAKQRNVVKSFATATIVTLLLASCASTPQSPPGAADVRAKLTRLQSDPNLGSRAPVEIREAEAAVQLAEVPVPKDKSLGSYRVYLADYKVEIAEAKATTRFAEDQRLQLSEEREHARLLARTREADMARLDADRARTEVDAARFAAASAAATAAQQAELARNESDRARDAAAAEAAQQKEELQRQIDLLEAKTTDRGLVLTLGNVLFATGKTDLKAGATTSLNKLVSFLNEYPDRNVVIEGHTDNVGTSASNQALSQRRAESVGSYLSQQGIDYKRIKTSGMGEDQPVAENDTETGRQQNRRVEIIIDNPPLVATAMVAEETTQ